MRIGIDLGGTKIEGAVLGPDGHITHRRRVATPSKSYGQIVTAIADLISSLENEAGATCSIGIGMPGTISPHSGLVKNSNTTVLNGKPFEQDLSTRIDRELRFENDANCFVLSESIDGAARGCSVVFGVIIGTGTGGGISIGQQVLRGANAVAGEWGHNPLPWATIGESDPPLCYCGKRGCIETYLCGAGLVSAYQALGGGDGQARQIAAHAQAGDVPAVRAMLIYADRLARSLATIVNVIDPDIVVLGGGLSNLTNLYETVPSLIGNYVFSDHVEFKMVPAAHGDSSGVRGAAWLWPAAE